MPKMGPRPGLDLGARLKFRSTRTLELRPILGIWTCSIWPIMDWHRIRLIIWLRLELHGFQDACASSVFLLADVSGAHVSQLSCPVDLITHVYWASKCPFMLTHGQQQEMRQPPSNLSKVIRAPLMPSLETLSSSYPGMKMSGVIPTAACQGRILV